MTRKKSKINKTDKKRKFNKCQLAGAFSLATIGTGIGFFMTGIVESAAPELFPNTERSLNQNAISDSSANKMLIGSGLFVAGTMVGISAVSLSSVRPSRKKPKKPSSSSPQKK